MRFLAVCAAGLLSSVVPIYAQSGTVRGSVLDPSGAAIKGASATIQNPVSHYSRTVTTDDQGKFEFENIPYNNYHFTASAPNFQTGEQDLAVRTPNPGRREDHLEARRRNAQRSTSPPRAPI